MRKVAARFVAVILLAALFSVFAIGCSKQAAGVKDEEVIKAVQTAIESITDGTKLASPIVIVEKSPKLQTGEYPVKVEYTVTLPDGSSKKDAVAYNIAPGGVNDMGVNIWNAVPVKK